MDIAVCGKDGKVNMIEAGAKEVAEETAVKGIEGALEEIAKLEEFQKKIIAEIGKEKIKIELKDKPKEAVALFEKNILPKLETLLYSSASGGARIKPDTDPLKRNGRNCSRSAPTKMLYHLPMKFLKTAWTSWFTAKL